MKVKALLSLVMFVVLVLACTPTDSTPREPGEYALTNDLAVDQHPTVSPDGKTVAFITYDRNIGSGVALISLEGEQTSLLTSIGNFAFFGLCWSSDGENLCTVVKPFSDDESNYLALIDIQTGDIAQVCDVGRDSIYPSWSPSSDRIAFVDYYPSLGECIFVVDVLAGTKKLVFPPTDDITPTSSCWTTDAEKIVFSGSRWLSGNQQWDIFSVNSLGEDLTQLTDTEMHEYYPCVSFDGTEICFIVLYDDDDSFDGELWIVSSQGGNPTALSLERQYNQPCYVPSGINGNSEDIVFVSSRNYEFGDLWLLVR